VWGRGAWASGVRAMCVASPPRRASGSRLVGEDMHAPLRPLSTGGGPNPAAGRGWYPLLRQQLSSNEQASRLFRRAANQGRGRGFLGNEFRTPERDSNPR